MFTILDDGTMDTVLLCDNCLSELRYSDADRDECGNLLPAWIQECEEEHADECDPCDLD